MKSIKKQIELEKQRAAKNPGKANKEARKANRGETFVGCRSTSFDSGKIKSKNRAAIKNETRRIINDY